MHTTQVLHPWHIPVGEKAPEYVNAVIEIPKGSRMKYELDKATGLLRLDRVLYSSIYYPLNYGLVPQTYFSDGDPQDILVICSFDIQPLCVVDAKIIGIMQMEDENGTDDKLLSVAANDPAFQHINDISDLPEHQLNELKHFFEKYKEFENKIVNVGELYGKAQAQQSVAKSIEQYHLKFGK